MPWFLGWSISFFCFRRSFCCCLASRLKSSTRWWNFILFVFHPEHWGKMNPFGRAYFFKWVGTQPPTSKIIPPENQDALSLNRPFAVVAKPCDINAVRTSQNVAYKNPCMHGIFAYISSIFNHKNTPKGRYTIHGVYLGIYNLKVVSLPFFKMVFHFGWW